MKNIKGLLLATMTMLFLGFGNVNAQESTSQTVIIRVLESPGVGLKPCIVITDSQGNSTKTELKKGLDESGENAVLIQNELNKWKNQGYKITEMSTAGETFFRTTIILEK